MDSLGTVSFPLTQLTFPLFSHRNVSSYLYGIPKKLAKLCACITRHTRNDRVNVSIRLYMLRSTGTPLLWAYSMFQPRGWIKWAGMLEFRKPIVTWKYYKCAYWYRPGWSTGCTNRSENEIPEPSQTFFPLLHSQLHGAGISCLVINEIPPTSYSDIYGITVIAAPKEKNTNFDQMYFATVAPLFIAEAGSHWADVVLGIRGLHGRPSLILECAKPFWALPEPSLEVGELFHVARGEECVDHVFRRGVCAAEERMKNFPPNEWEDYGLPRCFVSPRIGGSQGLWAISWLSVFSLILIL